MSPLRPGYGAGWIKMRFTHTPSLASSHITNVWSHRGGMPVLPSQSAIWLVLVSLLSAPRHLGLAAFHYRAVAARLPCCHCFWQVIIKMTLSHCELDSQVGGGPWLHTLNTQLSSLHAKYTQGHHSALIAGWGLEEMGGLMAIYISLSFYTASE